MGMQFGKRHQQMILNFFLIIIIYGIRTNLSMCIVAMTNRNSSISEEIPTYNWTNKNVILSSFFWGYILPQTLAGWLATNYGPKWFLIGAMTVCSLCGFMIPVAASSLGSKGVIVCRFIQGLSQGFVYPSVHTLIAKWVPPSERSICGALVYSASPLGTVIAMFASAYISASQYGWPMVFYSFSSVGLLWCLVFSIFGANEPSSHQSISEEEKMFISTSMGLVKVKKKIPTPWKDIFTSLPFLVLIVTQFGYGWGFWTLITQIPVYISEVMKFDLKANGILSSLPFLLEWMLGAVMSIMSDCLVNRKLCSVTTNRKIWLILGSVTSGISLAALANCGPDDANKAVALLFIAISTNCSGMITYMMNHMDLSPNHAGTLMGICNGFANISAILAPLAVQLIVTNDEDSNQWQYVFYLASGLFFFVAILYGSFGSGEVQPWNEEYTGTEGENEKMAALDRIPNRVSTQ